MKTLKPQSMIIFTTVSSGLILLTIYKYIRKKIADNREKRRLETLRNKKRKEREEQFAAFREEFFTQTASSPTNPNFKTIASITKLSVKDLQQALFKGDILAEEVLRAFIVKALEAQDEFNCITEFIPGALEKARALDERFMVKGPLHGIPFCVKDDTNVAGMDSTLGISRNLYKPSKTSAGIVLALESLGAVAFCRTNLPQTCISFGSGNPIFGTTLNPINKKLCPGGSSSGTACLVAAGGSPFGTGSDTGGSLRAPAHFCGISTLKPTSSRLTRKGSLKCVGNLPAVPGILAKSPTDVAIIYQALMESFLQNKIDASVVPISWNNQSYESKQRLRIGFYTSLSIFPSIGDTVSAVLKAKTYLESMGHLLIPFEFPFDVISFAELPFDVDLKGRLLYLLSDGNDEVADCIQELYSSTVHNSGELFSSALKLKIFSSMRTNSVFQDFFAKREELIAKVLDEMNLQELDQIICPVMPFCALGVNDISEFMEVCLYTMIYNWLDFPAGVVKFWTETGINWESSVNALPISESRKIKLLANEKECRGLPIGVQVVGRPFQEELVLKTLADLDGINT